MGRPKEFDRDEALERALIVFWKKGFDGASLQDLVEGMGVQRQSLYDTFGDKNALYLEALERYIETVSGGLLARLEAPGKSALAVLRDAFRAATGDGPDGCKGCFVVSAALERASSDAKVAACITRDVDRIEGVFRKLIEQAKREGEIPETTHPRATARALVTLLWGLRALNRAERDPAWLKSAVDGALGLLAGS